jgi:tetratricopeptide (TPR) repeat protein
MKKIILSALLMLGLVVQVSAQQEYVVNIEDREEAISLTEKGLRKIDAGNYPSAIIDLEKAIATDATFHPAYINLYKAYNQITGDKSRLLKIIEEGTNIFEEDDELTYYLGYLYYQKGEFPQAIREFTRAIGYSKINGEDFHLVYGYHFNRGNAYLKTKEFEKAIKDYSYALKLSPGNPDILTNRGIAKYQIKNSIEACKDWNKSVDEGGMTAQKYIKQFCQ